MRASKNHFHVFKNYFMILKRNIPNFSIYIIIFLALIVMFTMFNKDSNVKSFEQEKYDIIYIDNDNTALSKGLKTYLSKYAVFTDKYKTESEIKDALFAQEVKYIVRVPKGFTEDFLKNGSMQIEKTSGQDQKYSTIFDLAIKKYMSTAKLYNSNTENITSETLAQKTAVSVDKESKVEMKNFSVSDTGMNKTSAFFDFLCYGILNIIFLGVSSIMMAYNRKEISDRDAVGVIKPLSFNTQLFAGHLCYTLFTFACSFILSLIFLKPNLGSKQYWLFYLNVLCLCLSILSVSFLIGLFVKNRNVQNAIANVVSLGLSFFSGVFVPQDIMNSNVIAVARFTPTYWYVKATNDISELSSFSTTALSPVFKAMGIQIAFTVAFIAIAIVVSKQRESKTII